MAENNILDLESMANETLDNIQEAAGFTNPPAGEYSILCKDVVIDKYTDKAGASAQRMKITYAVVETKSTLNNEPPVPNETLFSETFQATEQGLGFFKARIREIMGASDVNGVTLGDMMSSAKGQIFNCRISYRKTEGKGVNAGKTYENLTLRIVK